MLPATPAMHGCLMSNRPTCEMHFQVVRLPTRAVAMDPTHWVVGVRSSAVETSRSDATGVAGTSDKEHLIQPNRVFDTVRTPQEVVEI